MPVIDTLSALGRVILAFLSMGFTTLVNLLVYACDFLWSFTSSVTNYLFSSVGFLAGVSRILPTHLYGFATVCASAYMIRALSHKIGG